ncbi:hypothetical protein PVAND_009147 [Polypedilum vanderplanki]|uniref:Pacifastin domain-containing protein n=1 Tax=Polypedilum vanderplanki TaxID=319348 RepID=A0A9J6CCW7_POLVA|nr:hypothetical protein PVAND_009147 [Polypedilum vanderplanki]
MKLIFAIALFSLSAVCVTSAEIKYKSPFVRDEPCEPGTEIKIECNTCICSDDKVFWCTGLACDPNYKNLNTKSKAALCEPGTVIKI